MLETNLKEQLKSYLERIDQPVEIVATLGSDSAAEALHSLLEELVSLSPHLSLKLEPEASVRTSSFSLARPNEPARVRFAGVPLGHEFTSLVLALLQVGGYPPKIEAALLEQVRALEGEFEFESFISLSCQNCPDVVQALNLMAVLNPGIRHTMIDGALFQSEVERLQILSVPAVYLNGAPFGQGRMTLEEIIGKLDTGAAARVVRDLNEQAPFDVLVVGAGPAGAAAAIYAARKGIRTGMVGERLGGQLHDTVGIENFISVTRTEGPKLAGGLAQHVSSYEVETIGQQRAEALIPGELIEIRLASGASLKSRAVVLATGARWREINVPGEREYRNRGVAYCPHCDGPLFKGRPVAVIGGGNSGVEAAIDLAALASHVTLLEFDAALRADAVLVRKLKSLRNVSIITNAQTTEVKGDDQRVNALIYKDRSSSELRTIELSGVFVQIGLVPNTDWLKGTVKLSAHGEVEIDARGQTNVSGVYAAGDCTTVPYKQIVVAVGEGAKASLSAFDHLIRTPVAEAA